MWCDVEGEGKVCEDEEPRMGWIATARLGLYSRVRTHKAEAGHSPTRQLTLFIPYTNMLASINLAST